jgi:phosphatidylglycerol lysyltransferase
MDQARTSDKRPGLLRRVAPALIAVVVVGACSWAIVDALKNQSIASIAAAFAAVPASALAKAVGLIGTNFLVMWAMEVLAMRDAGAGLSLRRAGLSAFISNALSIAMGLGPISGAGVRAGLFRAWGVPAEAAAATALGATLMSLAGGATIASIGLVLWPEAMAEAWGAPALIVRGVAVVVLAALCAGVLLSDRKRKLSFRGVTIAAPSRGGAALRLGLGGIDWIISANVFFALLNLSHGAAPLTFVSGFASAHFAGMAVGAPAGLGVFDALMLHNGTLGASSARVAAALLLYRLIGYAAPALIALGPFLALSRRAAVRPCQV